VFHAIQFASLARVKHLVAFHHDPAHDDATIDRIIVEAIEQARPAFHVTAAEEGTVLTVGAA
jgi:phosphoribosyl 1,2-cyclic phosphodiesterase